MRSIRNQLVLLLVVGTLLLTAVAGVGLYTYMEEVLERSLDAALAAKAEAIASAVHMEDDGKPHLQQDKQIGSSVNRHEGPFFFQILRDDGSTLVRSGPPGSANLPRLSRERRHFQDGGLSDGTSIRFTEISFLAHADEDEFDAPHQASKFPPAHLILVVAHDRRAVDGPLGVLLTGLLLAAVLVAGGILGIVTWGVRRGLRPLAEVSALADRIGPEALDVRFPGKDKLPAELQPIGQKLNELLDRLTAAFARERRFSAAVAHELRTPLAELRSACDVALAWPNDRDGLANAVAESRDIAIEMSNLVQTLLSVARQQAGIERSPNVETVKLAFVIDDVLSSIDTARAGRELTIDKQLDNSATVATDPALLRVVLRNLLENAFEYTPPKGHIWIQIKDTSAGRSSIKIANTCVGLTADDLPRLSEPFWRGDSSRTGTGHIGLGLTLVQVYCKAIDISVEVAIVSENKIGFTLELPSKLMGQAV